MTPSNTNANERRVDCDACGATATVVPREENQAFAFGEQGQEVELLAKVEVWSCSACGFSYTGAAAEEERHAAVCRHLGVLTPHEIRELRETHSLSQAAFAKLTGFGEATVKRWEAGLVIQNASADRYLRLLKDSCVYERAVAQANGSPPIDLPSRGRVIRFRTQLSAASLKAAQGFRLRAAVA